MKTCIIMFENPIEFKMIIVVRTEISVIYAYVYLCV